MKYGRLCVGPTSLIIWQALLVLQWVPRMKVTELYMWQAYVYVGVYSNQSCLNQSFDI